MAKLTKVLAAAVLVASVAPCWAAGEGKMSELEGEWSGSGTDRDRPFQSMQKITCKSKIRADHRNMNNEITCTTQSGARKTTHMKVVLDGTQLTGEVVQTVTNPREAMQQRKGSVSGTRVGNGADVQISFPMTPTARSRMVVHDASSYSIKVEALGALMMDVTFKRVGPPKEKEAKQPGQESKQAETQQ